MEMNGCTDSLTSAWTSQTKVVSPIRVSSKLITGKKTGLNTAVEGARSRPFVGINELKNC
jgi:hypothetical protein